MSLERKTMNFLEELQWRGLVKDCTNLEALQKQLETPTTVYCGFDPTADSLHVGHLQQIMLLKRYQKAGHKAIALAGGFTGMIGDPRPTTERKLLQHEDVLHNVQCIQQQLSMFIDFEGENPALLANNNDWLEKMTTLDFLRDFGKQFNIAYMLQKDTIKKRVDTGLSYLEFSYTILQAIDFYHLFKEYNCRIQIGGSDQWGNLTSGMDLIKKLEGSDTAVFGITSPLITKSDGSKFGKSEGKNIWLDPTRTSAYDFYQFWLNTPDDSAVDYLKRLSMKTPEEILALEASLKEAPEKREAQKALANELTIYVHGKEGLERALKISETLFSGDFMSLSPSELREGLSDAKKVLVTSGIGVIDALVAADISKSKSNARQLIQQGSISINGIKITELDGTLEKEEAIDQSFMIIKKGKKNYYIVEFE